MGSEFYFDCLSGGLGYVGISEGNSEKNLAKLEEYLEKMSYIPELIVRGKIFFAQSSKSDTGYRINLMATGHDGSTVFDLYIDALEGGYDGPGPRATIRCLELLGFKLSEEVKSKILTKADHPRPMVLEH